MTEFKNNWRDYQAGDYVRVQGERNNVFEIHYFEEMRDGTLFMVGFGGNRYRDGSGRFMWGRADYVRFPVSRIIKKVKSK